MGIEGAEPVETIDTWPHGEGWLTCLDVGSGDVWQASERGLTRNFHLDEMPAGSD